MKELLPGLLAVEVPEDAHSFTIDEHLFFRAYYMGLEKIGRMRKLPPGTWSILGIGTADKITEDEWKGMVEYAPALSWLLKLHGLNPETTVLLTASGQKQKT